MLMYKLLPFLINFVSLIHLYMYSRFLITCVFINPLTIPAGMKRHYNKGRYILPFFTKPLYSPSTIKDKGFHIILIDYIPSGS